MQQYPPNYSIYNPGGPFQWPMSISASISIDQCPAANAIPDGGNYSTSSFNIPQ